MQILVIDIGNTRATLGFFRSGVLLWRRDIATEALCCGIETFVAETLDLCVISCVSQRASHFLDGLRGLFGCPVVDVQTSQAPLIVHYANPERLGQDRIANALGAANHAPGGAIVVDFGTATHFDIVDDNGEFWGGPILAGVETMLQGLVARIPHLPAPPLDGPVCAVALDTDTAIRTGTILCAAGGIERIVREIRSECRFAPKVLITGGNAHLVEPHIAYDEWIPDLTLEGLCVYGMRTVARESRISA